MSMSIGKNTSQGKRLLKDAQALTPTERTIGRQKVFEVAP